MTRSQIPIREIVYGCISEGDCFKAGEKETELAKQDFTIEQAKEKKNTLESYVYETRNKVELILPSFLLVYCFTCSYGAIHISNFLHVVLCARVIYSFSFLSLHR